MPCLPYLTGSRERKRHLRSFVNGVSVCGVGVCTVLRFPEGALIGQHCHASCASNSSERSGADLKGNAVDRQRCHCTRLAAASSNAEPYLIRSTIRRGFTAASETAECLQLIRLKWLAHSGKQDRAPSVPGLTAKARAEFGPRFDTKQPWDGHCRGTVLTTPQPPGGGGQFVEDAQLWFCDEKVPTSPYRNSISLKQRPRLQVAKQQRA
jgi:hypothetical protein